MSRKKSWPKNKPTCNIVKPAVVLTFCLRPFKHRTSTTLFAAIFQVNSVLQMYSSTTFFPAASCHPVICNFMKSLNLGQVSNRGNLYFYLLHCSFRKWIIELNCLVQKLSEGKSKGRTDSGQKSSRARTRIIL